MFRFLRFINLHRGEAEKNEVLDNVVANISFRGSNLWILACAIVVASVGLNVNSPAVVIGAMLISPLMGPIVGAGFGLGVFDFKLLRKSLNNLLVATLVGLIVSATYFFISPFKESQTEILSRTSPNIYDIIIAFFGGLVGVIAITRVEKGNPIPGVAIATALMPPLCTAGFGLAVGNYAFFFGAMYLYSINCVFICIATFLIVKYLKYPIVKQIDKTRERQVKYAMTLLILIMLIPSVFFAAKLYNEKKYNQKVNDYLNEEFSQKGYTILYKKTDYTSKPKKIELAFLSHKFSKPELKDLNIRLKKYDIQDARLFIRQDTTDLKRDILNEINTGKMAFDAKDATISNLKKQILLNKIDNTEMLPEVKALFPEIKNIAISKHIFNENTDSAQVVSVVLYKGDKFMVGSDQNKLANWLKQRLKSSDVRIYGEVVKKQETVKRKSKK